MCDAEDLIGQTIAGKYVVDRMIGQGGMGTVLRAHHEELRTLVAIKVLRTAIKDNQEATKRFLREAQAAARIRSDHAVHVYDVGKLDTGEPYFVMEYLEGHDLATELHHRSELPVAEATDIVLQAMEAIAQAHSAGIIHRDLKPANLFLAVQSDGSRMVKVLDFGISKLLKDADPSITESATLLGSPLYMAPEQIRNASSVDEAADIWSLGVILYECLSGDPPYSGVTSSGVLATIVADDHQPLDERCKDLPESLCHVVEDCLVKNPKERIRTTAELAARLSVFATAEGRRLPAKIASILGVTPHQGGPHGVGPPHPLSGVPTHLDRHPPFPQTPLGTWSGGSASAVQDEWIRTAPQHPAADLDVSSGSLSSEAPETPQSEHQQVVDLVGGRPGASTAVSPQYRGDTLASSSSSSTRVPKRRITALPIAGGALVLCSIAVLALLSNRPPPDGSPTGAAPSHKGTIAPPAPSSQSAQAHSVTDPFAKHTTKQQEEAPVSAVPRDEPAQASKKVTPPETTDEAREQAPSAPPSNRSSWSKPNSGFSQVHREEDGQPRTKRPAAPMPAPPSEAEGPELPVDPLEGRH